METKQSMKLCNSLPREHEQSVKFIFRYPLKTKDKVLVQKTRQTTWFRVLF